MCIAFAQAAFAAQICKSVLMRRPQIKSDKQFARLWYEFYQLCLTTPELATTLSDNASQYAEWGDGSASFDQWWRQHSHLFAPARVERVTSASPVDGYIYLKVPLSLPLTRATDEAREVIRMAQASALTQRGLDASAHKSAALRLNRPELAGKETRGSSLYEALIVFRFWLSEGRPPINEAFATSLLATFQARKRANWLPHILTPRLQGADGPTFDPDQLRQIRRVKDRGYKAAQRVSEGQPPHY